MKNAFYFTLKTLLKIFKFWRHYGENQAADDLLLPKAFLKNKKRSVTSFPASFSA